MVQPSTDPSAMPSAQPITAASTEPKKRSKVLLLAVAGAALVLLGGVGTAAAVFLPDLLSGPGALPFEPERLPRGTKVVMKATYGAMIQTQAEIAASLVPEEAVWSELAQEPCDGTDLSTDLMIVSRNPEKASDWMIEHLAEALGPKLTATQLALRCGRDIARATQLDASSPTWVLMLEADKKTLSVQVIKSEQAKMPDTEPPFDARTFREHKGACKPLMKKGDDGKEVADKCGDESESVAMADKLWFHGQLSHLDEFMRHYDKPADELPIAGEVLAALAPSFRKHMISTIVTERDPRVGALGGSIGFAQSIGLGSIEKLSLFPMDRAKKTSDAISSRIRGQGTGWVMPDLEHGFRARVAFLGKDEDAAKSVASEVEDFRKEWRAHLQNQADDNAKKFHELTKDLTDTEREYKDAMYDLLMRGISKAVVDRSGLVVTMDLEPEPKETEQKAIRAWLKSRKEQSATAARIVRTLAAGKEAEPADLEAMGGKKLIEKIAELKRGKGM